MIPRIDPRFIDNDLYLWLKLGLTTLSDRVGIARKADRYGEVFRQIGTYCLFIGYPRSGHSVVGSTLDAHPDAVLAHRLDSLKFAQAGRTLPELAYLMLRNSQRFARTGRKLTGYSYRVPGQWQGRFRSLRVIGDQEGKWTSLRLAGDPPLLDRLLALAPVRVRFIHVTRNPFDNITTWSLRGGMTLERSIKRYFALCDDVAAVTRRLPAGSLAEVRHETFVTACEPTLRSLCSFLDLEAEEGYLRDCARIVYPRPRQSRGLVPWPTSLVDRVSRAMDAYPFLRGYQFDG